MLQPSQTMCDASTAPPQSVATNADHRARVNGVGPGPSVTDDYLLVCDASSDSLVSGSWRFTLETADGQPVFAAADRDCGDLNRLALLAAVRGLESIDGPSNVTLLSHNRYLIRSLSDSLPRWRENDFVWEHFGRRIDVQHADLWRRVDRALSIHRVEAVLVSSRLVSGGPQDSLADSSGQGRHWRIDGAHAGVPRPKRRARHGPPPADQLRRWLIGQGDPERHPTGRRVPREHPDTAAEFAAPA